MKMRQMFLTKNDCYKTGKTITPRGIMVHSTGANNPNLCRYVGPDDGLLGVNQYGNHWNQPTPDGRQVCVHAFIGKVKNGEIYTYQTLPWNMRAWHAGSGPKGTANDSHISFEICEDALTDEVYFNKVYREAVELSAKLCREYKLTPEVIIDHSEGYSLGVASNHADVGYWLKKFSKTMDDFRNDVKKELTLSPEEIVACLQKQGLVSLPNYWLDVLNGRTAPKTENVRALLTNVCGKMCQ